MTGIARTGLHKPACTLVAAAMLIALTAGCDSDNKEDGVSQEALTQMSSMMAKVQSMMTLALSQISFTATVAGKKGAPARPARVETIECPQGGQLTFDGTITSNEAGTGTSFDLSMELDDCNGVDGSLAYVGQGAFTETTYQYSISMNGSLQEQCTLSYNNYSQEITANISTGSSTVVIDGSMGVQCGASSFTCSFDNLTYNSGDSSIGAFEGACR